MTDIKQHLHCYKYIKLEANHLQYKINHDLQSDGVDEFFICTRNKCKSKQIQSFYLARYSEQDEFTNPITIRGQRVQLI